VSEGRDRWLAGDDPSIFRKIDVDIYVILSPHMLCTLHDGSRLRTLGAKELIEIPIWKGNRIIDMVHVQRIKDGIRGNVQKLEFSYRVARITEMDAGGNPITMSYVIDGQHRHKVLCDHYKENLCEPDFPVVVLEKDMTCEAEIISYFRELNCQKPIEWKSDPMVLANQYIAQLIAEFNFGAKKLIRQGSTQRPYVSVDALRDALFACKDMLKEGDSVAFARRVLEYNANRLKGADMPVILGYKKADAEKIQKAAALRFMLAVDKNLPWVRECLRS
jgi:hypothetical protein